MLRCLLAWPYSLHILYLSGSSYGIDQVYGLISIGTLNTLLYLHSQPIYHVVFMESHRDTLS